MSAPRSWIVFLALVTGTLAVADQSPLQPRRPLPKPATITRPPYESFLTVKFRDDLKVRAVDGAPVSRAGQELPLVRSMRDHYGLFFEPLIRVPQERLDALTERAAERSGVAQPDLAGMLIVRGPDPYMEQAAASLLALDAVEWAEFASLRPEPPCTDISPSTPNYFAQGLQGYHDPDPGVNAPYAWSLGARGLGIRIADCEYGYIQGTEDLCDIEDEPGQTVHPDVPLSWTYHGSAVLGEMVGLDNSYGVTGLAPDASAYFFTEWSAEEDERRVTAITNAIATVSPGDIVVLEMQTDGSTGFGPAELELAVWTVTRVGTDAGVIVVAAAGNGDQNLDSSGYDDYRSLGDSGAIIVGAGTDSIAHDRLWFSTYGSRVNVQGWGTGVFTLGYGDYAQLGGDPRQTYIADFGGTSSATPIVAGSIALLQSLAEQTFACRLAPRAMRQLLIDTGIPQGSGGHIGPFPDLETAADDLLAQSGCDYPHCGDGVRNGSEICDGADAEACPGFCLEDCTCAPVTTGETFNILVDIGDRPWRLWISYDPACEASGHTIVYGPLHQVGSYGYTGQICEIGADGEYGPFSLGLYSYFFLIVGNDGAGSEGSYGRDSFGLERPEDLGDPICVLTQDLSNSCDP